MVTTKSVLVSSVAIILILYFFIFFTEIKIAPIIASESEETPIKQQPSKPTSAAHIPTPIPTLEPEPPIISPPPAWNINNPDYFYNRSFDGSMVDVREIPEEINKFIKLVEDTKPHPYTDYEIVDAIEQFFWGQKNGLCIELGATGGGPETHSQTYDYEDRLGWRRILIEGNPTMREDLLKTSPKSFVVSAAVCKDKTTLHYVINGLVSGVIEFMNEKYMKDFYGPLYNRMVPPGNVASVDWSTVTDIKFEPIDCVPMSTILRQAKAKHVNYFILDVEGAEYSILETIDWDRYTFDVVCIEIDPDYRPVGNTEKIIRYMAKKGYMNYSGLIGRNIWFTRNDFIPFKRPGLKDNCFRKDCPRH